MFFSVILVTHPKSYIETTDRRDFGGKPSMCRWGRVLSWKMPEFCSVDGPRSKTTFFRVFRVPFDYPEHSLQETVLPQTNGTAGKPRLGRCAFCSSGESVSRHLGNIGPRRVTKSGHVTVMKIENLHIATRRKIHWFQKCYSFRSTTKFYEVIAENNFGTVASPGACGVFSTPQF